MNNAFCYLPASLFAFSFYNLESRIFPEFSGGGVAFEGLFLAPCMSMLWSIYRRYCSYCSTARKAQHSKAQSARTEPPSKYVPIRVRQRKQANRAHLLYCSRASKAQHSTISPLKAAKQVRAHQCDNASKQTDANVVEHLLSTLSSQNERRNQNLPGLQIYTTTHTALLSVMREGFCC